MNLGEGCYLDLVTPRSVVQIYSIKFFSLGKAISSLVDIKKKRLVLDGSRFNLFVPKVFGEN